MDLLQHSAAYDDAESELQQIMMRIYDDELRPTADEINVYGAPFLGSIALLERLVTADGLAIPRKHSGQDSIRYLFKAWNYLNPERGFHFLKAYLQALWGESYEVNQMWQKKSEPYPTYLRTMAQVAGVESDYFLTSRVIVDLDIEEDVPEALQKAIRTAVAARFLLQLRIFKKLSNELLLGQVFHGYVAHIVSGNLVDP